MRQKTRPFWSFAQLWAALLAVVGVSSCASLPEPPAPVATDTSVASPHPLCQYWPQTCVKGLIHACNPATGKHDVPAGTCPAGYDCGAAGCLPKCTQETAQCSPDGLTVWECDAKRVGKVPATIRLCSGATPKCVAGECAGVCSSGSPPGCVDDRHRRTCVAGAWVSELCPAAQPVCADGACTHLCASEFTACNKELEVICQAGKPAKVQSCTGALQSCQQGLCVTKECEGVQKACQGGKLATCQAGMWSEPQACDPGYTCKGTGCEGLPCAEGAVGCAGYAVVRCQAGSAKVEELCKFPDTCRGGRCVEACTQGRSWCAGGDLKRCDSGVLPTTEACGPGLQCLELGDQATCTQAPCSKAGYSCLVNHIVACSGPGSYSASSSTACAVGQVCSQGDCIPGPSVCKMDSYPSPVCLKGQAVGCNIDGQWRLSDPCLGPNEYCASAGCKAAACRPGASFCVGNAVKGCGGGGWGTETCAANQMCQLGHCLTPKCEPNWKPPADQPKLGFRAVQWQWLPPGSGCNLGGSAAADNGAWLLEPWLPSKTLQNWAGAAVEVVVAPTVQAGAELQLWAAMPTPLGLEVLNHSVDRSVADCPSLFRLPAKPAAPWQWQADPAAVLLLPLPGLGYALQMPLRRVQAQAQAVAGDPKSWDLTVCGALDIAAWLQRLDLAPALLFTELSASRTVMVAALVKDLWPDVDADGNGLPESLGVAVRIRLQAE